MRSLQFSARVATLSRVDVGSTITGRVERVQVREGAQVRAGELLVALESQELSAALAQAVAAEQQAQARVEAAVAFALASPDPLPASAREHVFASVSARP